MAGTKTSAAAEAARLAQEASAAADAARSAQARADAAAREAEARKQERWEAIRQRRYEEFDEPALRGEVTAARQAFAAAVLADDRPLAAYVEWSVATAKFYELAQEHAGRYAQLNPAASPLSYSSEAPAYAEIVQRILEEEVARQGNDFREERHRDFDEEAG